MRTITCRACRRTLDEAHVLWGQGSSSGRCPFCRRFYDPAREAQSGVVATDPEVRRRSATRRALSGVVGAFLLACVAGTVIAERALGQGLKRIEHPLFVGEVAVSVLGLALLGWAIFGKPRGQPGPRADARPEARPDALETGDEK